MPVPLTWDDKAGCISAHRGGKRLVTDLCFSCIFSRRAVLLLFEQQEIGWDIGAGKPTCGRMELARMEVSR